MEYFLLSCMLLLTFQGYVDSQQPTWSYSGNTGPQNWPSTCDGELQSPINIVDSDSVQSTILDPWAPTGFFNPDGPSLGPPRAESVTNTGNTVRIHLSEGYTLSGVGLPGTYICEFFEVHWGAINSRGSEHTVDGRQYSAELQLVYYNDIYPDLETAATRPAGVGISAWFIEEGEYNMGWEPVLSKTNEYRLPGSNYEFQREEAFEVGFLLAEDINNFYRYNGSWTYPPCYETVIWSVFQDTVSLSRQQLDMLRSLLMYNGQQLVDNFRPVQPLNDRRLGAVAKVKIPTEEELSCSGKCNNQFDESFPCQCNSRCRAYGDCCEDYEEHCLVEICSLVHTYGNKMRKMQQRP